MSYYYGYSSSRVSEAVLPKNMQQFLLPKLAATQRLARAENGTYPQPEFDDLRPLAWDDGPPWRFRLDIQADDARQCWILSGQLYRPGSDETLPVQAPRMIFRQGLVLSEDRIAPLEASGSAWMIEALRKTPEVEVPYKRPLGIAAAALAIAQRPGNERAGQSPRRGGSVAAARTPDDRQAGTLRSLSPARPRRFPVRRQVGLRPGDRAGDRRRSEGADPGPRPATRARAGRVAGFPGHSAHGGLAGREVQHLDPQPKAPRGGRIAGGRRMDRRGPRVSSSAARARGG